MRYVRFGGRADFNRNALPPALRRQVTDKIKQLASEPDPTKADDLLLVAPAGPNSGLIMAVVIYARNLVLIVYRIEKVTDEIWIEALERVYADDPAVFNSRRPSSGASSRN